MRPVGVLVVHGIGSQGPDFADPFIARVSKRLGPASDAVLWQRMRRWRRLDWVRLRRFVIDNFGDAVAYRYAPGRSNDTYRRIHGVLHAALGELERRLEARGAVRAPLVIVAHSLGCVIASNYVWDRQHWLGPEPDPLGKTVFARMETLVGMVTLGGNMPLFTLAYERVVPILLPGRAVTPGDASQARWINWFDRDDVLGWPLRPVYEPHAQSLSADAAATVERIEDRPVRIGGLLGWTPVSHLGYWRHPTVVDETARYLAHLAAT